MPVIISRHLSSNALRPSSPWYDETLNWFAFTPVTPIFICADSIVQLVCVPGRDIEYDFTTIILICLGNCCLSLDVNKPSITGIRP